MSDYLNNLAAKSINLTEVVQPRLTSLFEPPPVSGWPDSGPHPGLEAAGGKQASDETELGPSSSPRQTAEQPPVSRSPVTGLRPPSDTWQQQPAESSVMPSLRPGQQIGHPQSLRTLAELQPSDRSTSEQGQPVVVSLSVEPAPQKQRPTGRQPLQPREDSQPVEARSVQRPGFPAPSLERPASSAILSPLMQPITPRQFAKNGPQHPVSERPRSPLMTGGHETEAQSSQSVIKGDQQPALEPLVQEIVVERMISPAVPPTTDVTSAKSEEAPSLNTAERESQTALQRDVPRPEASPMPEIPARVVVQPHVTPYVEPAVPIPTGPMPRPESAPTIQVTIGRVEVRATTPTPQSSKKQRPKPPIMSLDEYLSLRASGGDR